MGPKPGNGLSSSGGWVASLTGPRSIMPRFNNKYTLLLMVPVNDRKYIPVDQMKCTHALKLTYCGGAYFCARPWKWELHIVGGTRVGHVSC